METQIFYKIRRKTDGLFSTGGSAPTFTKKGKVWNQRGHVSSHLNCVGSRDKTINDYYADCELVMMEYVEVETLTMETFMAEKLQAKAKRDAAEKERRLKYKRERLLQEQKRIDEELNNIGN